MPPLVRCGLQLIGVGGTSRVLHIIRSNTGVGMWLTLLSNLTDVFWVFITFWT